MTYSAAPRPVPVWDLPVRLFHWTLAFLVVAAVVTGKLGRLDLHMKPGAAILALLLFRLAWGAVGSRTARFSDFVKGPAAIAAFLRETRAGRPVDRVGHNPLGALSVVALLAVALAQAATGLFTSDDIMTEGPLAWAVSAKTVSLLSTVHRLGVKALLALIALHLGAIAFYRLAKGEDLVSPMITGWRPMPTYVPGNSGGHPAIAALLAAAAAAAVWGVLAVWGR